MHSKTLINLFVFINPYFCVGRWSVKNIKPTPTGEPQEIRVKVRINDNGLILVTSASIVEKKAKEPEPPQPAGDNAAPNSENGNNMDTTEVSPFPANQMNHL